MLTSIVVSLPSILIVADAFAVPASTLPFLEASPAITRSLSSSANSGVPATISEVAANIFALPLTISVPPATATARQIERILLPFFERTSKIIPAKLRAARTTNTIGSESSPVLTLLSVAATAGLSSAGVTSASF